MVTNLVDLTWKNLVKREEDLPVDAEEGDARYVSGDDHSYVFLDGKWTAISGITAPFNKDDLVKTVVEMPGIPSGAAARVLEVRRAENMVIVQWANGSIGATHPHWIAKVDLIEGIGGLA